MSKPLSFEKSLSALEEIVKQLEKGELPLDEMLKKYEKGVVLARGCQATLAQAEQKIKLVQATDATLAEVDSDD